MLSGTVLMSPGTGFCWGHVKAPPYLLCVGSGGPQTCPAITSFPQFLTPWWKSSSTRVCRPS